MPDETIDIPEQIYTSEQVEAVRAFYNFDTKLSGEDYKIAYEMLADGLNSDLPVLINTIGYLEEALQDIMRLAYNTPASPGGMGNLANKALERTWRSVSVT
jgi:hypothetical protein